MQNKYITETTSQLSRSKALPGYPEGIPPALRRQIEDAHAREQAGERVCPIIGSFIGPDGRRKKLVYLPERYWPADDAPLFQPGGAA